MSSHQTDSTSRAPQLRVSSNRRWLECADERPFFRLGDAAWELFHRSTREEADLRLSNRARQGYTVIQAGIPAELDGLDTRSTCGSNWMLVLDAAASGFPPPGTPWGPQAATMGSQNGAYR